MTVRVYRWDDASAPSLCGVIGSSANSLIALLDAVLVGTAGTAYGSKPSAGWTKDGMSTSTIAVYRNSGGTNRYLRVDCSSAGVARITAYKTMSDINTGTVQTPTTAQLSGGLYLYVSNTSDTTLRPWLIAADSKRFFMWNGFSQTTAAGLVSSSYQNTCFFGDPIPGRGDDTRHFTLISSGSAGATNGCHFGNIVSGVSSNTPGHFVMGTAAQVDGSVLGGKINDGLVSMSYMGGAGGLAYPDPVSGSMLLAPIRVCDSNQLRGYLPGLWQPIHNLPGNPGDTFSGTGDLAGKTFLLLDTSAGGPTRCRVVLETSDTWS